MNNSANRKSLSTIFFRDKPQFRSLYQKQIPIKKMVRSRGTISNEEKKAPGANGSGNYTFTSYHRNELWTKQKFPLLIAIVTLDTRWELSLDIFLLGRYLLCDFQRHQRVRSDFQSCGPQKARQGRKIHWRIRAHYFIPIHTYPTKPCFHTSSPCITGVSGLYYQELAFWPRSFFIRPWHLSHSLSR